MPSTFLNEHSKTPLFPSPSSVLGNFSNATLPFQWLLYRFTDTVDLCPLDDLSVFPFFRIGFLPHPAMRKGIRASAFLLFLPLHKDTLTLPPLPPFLPLFGGPSFDFFPFLSFFYALRRLADYEVLFCSCLCRFSFSSHSPPFTSPLFHSLFLSLTDIFSFFPQSIPPESAIPDYRISVCPLSAQPPFFLSPARIFSSLLSTHR